MSLFNIDRFDGQENDNSRLYGWIAIACIGALLYILFFRQAPMDEVRTEAVRDTVVVRDTIVMPVAVVDTVVKTIYRAFPAVVETRTDTVTVIDSVMVELPISRKVYEDSAYMATISGYEPKLEELIIKHREVTVIPPKDKRKRWNIGPSAGVCFGKDGMTPYVGIGVQYAIFQW